MITSGQPSGATVQPDNPIQSRPCQVHTQASLPSASASTQNAGAAALSLAYRLAPEFPFPAGLRDAIDAYRFLLTKGFPARSIVLAGDGSGGGLAFSTLLGIRNAGLEMPAACIALSPWADMTLSGNKLAVRGCVFGICRDGGTWTRVK